MDDLIMWVIVSIFLFFVFREILCWYWKINEAVSLLKEIRDLLKPPIDEDTEIPEEEPTPMFGLGDFSDLRERYKVN